MIHTPSYLLDIARFPDLYYALYHGLTGRDAIYKNPGVSIRSYAIAHVHLEFVTLKGDLVVAYEECKSFCYDKDVLNGINRMLRERPYDLCEQILNAGGASKMLNSCISRLNSLNRIKDELFMKLQLEDFDYLSNTARHYRENLGYIRDVMYEVEELLRITTGNQSA